MLKRIKLLLTDNAMVIAIAITIFIAYLSLINLNEIDLPEFTPSDKVSHMIAYFTLAVSWLYASANTSNFKKYFWWAILGCFIYGIVIEVLQGELTTYRTASYLDMLANSIGITLAVLFFHLVEKKNRLI